LRTLLTSKLDLVTYCVKQDVPFTEFENWSSILAIVKRIAAGETDVKTVAAEGHEDFKKRHNKN
jgi:hypothetical protein